MIELIHNKYIEACQQIEVLMKKQGLSDIKASLQYDHPHIAKIK